MTTTPTAYTQFGYSLAMAEQSLTAVLSAHLAERDTEPETWYALQLLAMRGPTLERGTLLSLLGRSRTLSAELAQQLLPRLEAEGLIGGESEVELTAAGQALHRSLSEYVAAARDELLGEFDLADVETTVRTIQAIGDRAAEQAASAPAR